MQDEAGSLTTAFKYFADVYAGKLEFDYSVAEFMRNLIASQLIAEEGIDYEQGDDVLPAMHQLIDLAAKNSSKASSREKRTFQLNNLPAEFKTDFSRRYITSLLAKPFVILAGNSGTGKTRISKRFAKYLEVLDEDGEPNWLLVPVGADWTDNTKVLGFFNPIADGGKGAYEETGILRLIERANANPEVPYFLILDEMNLSHVERYFSDFLSHMETIGEDNLIVLDGYGDGGADRLPYPQNLFVVGTVNIDETTYMFSPKVLDRANVIEFKPSRPKSSQGSKPSRMRRTLPSQLPASPRLFCVSPRTYGREPITSAKMMLTPSSRSSASCMKSWRNAAMSLPSAPCAKCECTLMPRTSLTARTTNSSVLSMSRLSRRCCRSSMVTSVRSAICLKA